MGDRRRRTSGEMVGCLSQILGEMGDRRRRAPGGAGGDGRLPATCPGGTGAGLGRGTLPWRIGYSACRRRHSLGLIPHHELNARGKRPVRLELCEATPQFGLKVAPHGIVVAHERNVHVGRAEADDVARGRLHGAAQNSANALSSGCSCIWADVASILSRRMPAPKRQDVDERRDQHCLTTRRIRGWGRRKNTITCHAAIKARHLGGETRHPA
jgi:hypothetical protein